MSDTSSDWQEIGGQEAAEQAIRTIRQGYGVDTVTVPKDIKENLQRACLLVANQLNESRTHFLSELIQNADDNRYTCDVPTIVISFDGDYIQLECNEVGFTKANLKAICSLGDSSKKKEKGVTEYIGEKGIGFKSVFRVADVVWISSGYYNFKLDSTSPLGMIVPVLADFPVAKRDGWTSFYLRLRNGAEGPSLRQEVRNELQDLDPGIITFLRELRHITVRVRDTSSGDWSVSNLTRTFGHWNDNEMINLSKDNAETAYLVHRGSVQGMPPEDRRGRASTSDVMLAFPVDENKIPVIAQAQVFAFLPVADFGFSFLVHADFLLTANRENVESCAWNRQLRDGLVEAFELSAKHFNETTLQYTWIRFLPQDTGSHSFFGRLKRRICDALKTSAVLRAWDESLQRPDRMVYVPEKYRDEEGAPITLTTSNETTYISGSYANADLQYLKRLGVEEMDDNEFLANFKSLMRGADSPGFKQKPAQWHRSLARVLNQLPDRAMLTLRDLPLIKLRSGAWIPASVGAIYFPGIGGWAVPGAVDIQIVDSEVADDPARHQLCSRLGITHLSFVVVQDVIVRLHETLLDPSTIPVSDLIAQAYFLFNTGWTNRSATQLWVATELGRRIRTGKAYMDGDCKHAASRFFRDQRAEFGFLHPTYADVVSHPHSVQDWFKWLHETAGVARTPRLVASNAPGRICPDFNHVIRTNPSSDWLELLCEHWKYYKECLESPEKASDKIKADRKDLRAQLLTTPVTCTDGSMRPLNQTCLPLAQFTSIGSNLVPLLQVPEAEHARWQSLEYLGVVVKNHVKFYLQCLTKLSGTNGNLTKVRSLLGQIQARCGKSEEEFVRTYFRDSREPLIFVPDPKPVVDKGNVDDGNDNYDDDDDDDDSSEDEGDDDTLAAGTWYPVERCLWSGPRCFRVHICLSEVYPATKVLFKEVLGIPDTGFSHLLDEAQSFRQQDSRRYIASTLTTMGKFIYKNGLNGDDFAKLMRTRIWPVRFPHTQQVQFRSSAPNDEWFIADTDPWRQIFDHAIPVLFFDVDAQYPMRHLIKALDLHRRYITELHSFTVESKGRVDINIAYTELFRSKYRFFVRIIRALEDFPRKEEKLALLKKIEVYTAHEVFVRCKVPYRGQWVEGLQSRENAVVDVKPERLEVYLIDGYLETDLTYSELVFSMIAALGVNIRKNHRFFQVLFSVIRAENDQLDALLDRHGIPRRAADDENDDWLKNTKQTTGFGVGAGGSGDAADDTDSRFFVVSSGNFDQFGFLFTGGEGASNATGSGDEGTEEDGGRRFLVISPRANSEARRMFGVSSGGMHTFDEHLQFLGELEVSNWLEKKLGEKYKPLEHWTSRHRTKAGLAPFDEAEIEGGRTPFRVPDPDGTLTKFVAKGIPEAKYWQRKPPTWHLEVKASYGGPSEEFSLTGTEFERARRFWARKGVQQAIPTDTLALIRVYEVESEEPGFISFPEPWTCYLEGQIKFRCDGVMMGSLGQGNT